MKYLNLVLYTNIIPTCIDNFSQIVCRIGEINPENINCTSLFRKYNKEEMQPTKSNYFKMGILNLRKNLNRHLGHSGKYSNRMIRKISNISKKRISQRSFLLKESVPHAEYINIVKMAYKILYEIDPMMAADLYKMHENDNYDGKATSSICFGTVAPIQTSIILSAVCIGNEKFEFLRNGIIRG